MKRMNFLFVVTFILSSLLSALPLHAQTVDGGQDVANLNKIFLPIVTNSQPSTSFQFPVLPGSAEWSKFTSHEEMVAATQIPDDVLANMSSGELANVVLSYPLWVDLMAYNSPQQGLEALAANFNGVRTLLERPDAGEVLLRTYQSTDTSAVKAAWSLEEQGLYDANLTHLETLLAQPSVLNTLNENAQKGLLSESLTKFRQKQEREDVYGQWGRERSALIMGRVLQTTQVGAAAELAADPQLQTFLTDGNFASQETLQSLVNLTEELLGVSSDIPLIDTAINSAAVNDYNLYVYTPRGSSVLVTVMTYEFSAAQIASANAQADSRYPYAVRVSNASRRYNCHSFAWYYASTANTAWMTTPSDDKYWLDGSYRRIATANGSAGIPSIVPNGARVSYSKDDHSAIKYTATALIGKWGQLPIMVHPSAYAPYNTTSLNYYVR